MIRPVRALTEATRRMRAGDGTARATTSSRWEIAELTAAFNEMAEHVARTDRQRKELVNDISHELRTPLSTIKGWLIAAHDGVAALDTELVSSLLEETLLLQHLVDDLRDLALADAGQLRLEPVELDLGGLLGHIAAAGGGRAIVEVPPDLRVVADPIRLRQAVGNLVANAERHTPPEGRITIRAKPSGEFVLVEVTDTGPGIAAADLPSVFERFWRADKSRNRRTGGSGLGYGAATPFTGRKSGTVTWLPAVGDVIGQGQTLYGVDAQPVVFFLGATPLYRAINAQATPGPDIAEVNANLRSLGYRTAPTNDAYTSGTETALKMWQHSKGLTTNGTLAIGDVAVLPAPVSVSSLEAQLGASATADLLSLSSTTKYVTATVDPRQVDTSVLTPGLKVSLSLPDGKQTDGTVAALSAPSAAARPVRTPPAEGDRPDDRRHRRPVIAVRHGLRLGRSHRDQGSGKKVLAVPIEALVVVQGGGYAVQVVAGTGHTSILVAVQTGLFADGLVEISGQGVIEGLKVVTVS